MPDDGADRVLRDASRGDVDAIARVWVAGWREAHLGRVPDALVAARPEASFAVRAEANLPRTTVATIDAAVVGFVVVAGDELEQLYLSSAHRGRGVAGMLLAAGERRIAAGGHATAWLAVVAGNASARRFYERAGWVDEGAFVHDAPGGVAVPARRYVKVVA